MRTPSSRQSRRATALVGLTAGTILGLVGLHSVPARADKACFSHPKTKPQLKLHLKTVCHDSDASTITYTMEAHEAFQDRDVDLRWGIDKNGDQKYDLFVSVEFDGALTATVEDANENQVGHATVTRTAPNALRVSYSRQFLGGVSSYGYNVRAVTDLNGNGEVEPGEEDVAPESGFYQHRL